MDMRIKTMTPITDFPWVLFRLENEYFALSSMHVQSMIELPDVTYAPNLPKYVRGFMNYNGQTIQLIDMRGRMDFKPLYAEIREFADLMDAREQDHRKWLSVLEECVRQRKEFTLALDPTKCKFGQWYYGYLPKVKNNSLRFLLEQFEFPHEIIHGIAAQAFALLHAEKIEAALDLINETRNSQLAKMIDLFAKVKETYKACQREIAILLNPNITNYPAALIVDEIIAVERLSEHHWSRINQTLVNYLDSTGMITGTAEFPEIRLSALTINVSNCVV